MFLRWVTSGQTVKDLTFSFSSKNSLLRHFYQFLDKPPLIKPLVKPKAIYLKVDGSYFGRWGCVLVFKEGTNIIFWDFVERENYFNYCLNLAKVTKIGYVIRGVTSDRHGSLLSAIKTLFPNIPHQYCLVHLQRFCQSLLTQKPQTQAGKDLLEIVKLLNYIHNHDETGIWIKWLERYEKRYLKEINQRSYLKIEEGKLTWWYTHKNVRRAFNTLKSSLNNLFLYLVYPNLPKDINGLEGEFSHLKRKISLHRGLKRERKINLVKWYFFFRSQRGKNSEKT